MGFYGRVVLYIDFSSIPEDAREEIVALLENHGLIGEIETDELLYDRVDFHSYDLLDELEERFLEIKKKYNLRDGFAEIMVYYMDEPDEYIKI